MADYRADPNPEIPESDLLDQHPPEESDALTDLEAAETAKSAGQADEADLLEQVEPVSGDEDYPHAAQE